MEKITFTNVEVANVIGEYANVIENDDTLSELEKDAYAKVLVDISTLFIEYAGMRKLYNIPFLDDINYLGVLNG